MAGLSASGAASGPIRAGRAYVEMFLNDNAVWRAMDRVRARFQAFGALTAKAGLAVGGVGASITAAFKPALDALGDNAQIADLADLFNITGEKASRLFGIMAAGGSDLRDAQEGLATFNQRINDALSGKGEEAADLFKQLGVGAEEFAGLDTADRFYKLTGAIQASNSPLGKLGLLMKAVGEDTGKNLGGVLQLTSDQIRELGDAFETSSDDLNTARDAARAQTLAMASLKKVWSEIATAIAPGVKDFAGQVTAMVKPVVEFVRNNREVVATVLKVGGALTAAGAGLVALGAVIGGASTAFGGLIAAAGLIGSVAVGAVKLLAAAVSALLSPVGLVAAAVAGLGYLWVTQTESGAKAFDGVKGALGQFADYMAGWARQVAGVATEAWGGIVAAVQKGDLKLAGEIAVTALELIWEQALVRMRKLWSEFTTPLVEIWHEATDGMGEIFREVGAVVKEVAGDIWAVVSNTFNGIWEAVAPVIERIKEAWNSLSDSTKAVIATVAAVLNPILAPFLLLAGAVRDAWDGMSNNVTENLNNLVGWFEKAFVRIKGFVVNTFVDMGSAALTFGIRALEALDKADPTSSLRGAIDELKAMRDAAEGSRVNVEAEVASIEAQTKALNEKLKTEREAAKKAREEGRKDDAEKADARAKELDARLKELVARAKEPKPGAIEVAPAPHDFGPAVARAATITGSRGSFTAAAAAQRFGADTIPKQQLKKIEETAANTLTAAIKLAEIAAGLRLR